MHNNEQVETEPRPTLGKKTATLIQIMVFILWNIILFVFVYLRPVILLISSSFAYLDIRRRNWIIWNRLNDRLKLRNGAKPVSFAGWQTGRHF